MKYEEKSKSTMLSLHPARLIEKLAGNKMVKAAVLFDEVASTNEIAFKVCGAGYGDGWLIMAHKQTAGRGRLGRKWFSSTGRGLTFSLVTKCDKNAEELTMLMALSALEAIEDMGVEDIFIKWPNDLFLGGRKLCGILAEAFRDMVVIGVGINVNEGKDDFPEEIANLATSLASWTGGFFDCGDVLVSVIAKFERNFDIWKKSGLKAFRERITERLLYLGEDVTIVAGSKSIEGRFIGIADNGRLLLDVDDRHLEISSGDVSLRGEG